MKKYKNFIINNFHSNKNFAILTNFILSNISLNIQHEFLEKNFILKILKTIE